jgi:hypothetical protein
MVPGLARAMKQTKTLSTCRYLNLVTHQKIIVLLIENSQVVSTDYGGNGGGYMLSSLNFASKVTHLPALNEKIPIKHIILKSVS